MEQNLTDDCGLAETDSGEGLQPRTIAFEVGRRGLSAPVILLLELYRPLSTLGYSALITIEPLASLFLGRLRTARILEFFERRENIELLISALELVETKRNARR